jgi:hypothetical protein
MNQGHANFLDVLVSELDLDDDEDEVASPLEEPIHVHKPSPLQRQTLVVPDETAKDDVEGNGEELDGEDTASDNWSEYDNSDDDDHALVRTISRRASATDVKVITEERSTTETLTETRESYFQFDHSQHTFITVEDVLVIEEVEQPGEDYKKDAIVTVTIASANSTPPESPADEIVLGGTG